MYSTNRLALTLATLITPALLAAGCSSHQSKPDYSATTTENVSDQPQITQNLASLPADSDTAIKTTADTAVSDVTLTEPEPTTAPTIESADNTGDPMLEEIMATTDAMPGPDSEDADTTERPALTLFRFGFDKNELGEQDRAIVIQHGQFLAQHPDKKIQLHGHADAQGDSAYNRYLATLRARHVAELLQAQGVSKDQIEIFSWGSEKPRNAVNQWKDNRRVELMYEESFMVQAEEETPEKGNPKTAL
ncbi:MAG: OmpA family protein [Ketobacteraceae bacterium]|nr:OmpA family protein [Ketobacteraceae bacterium]